jgi:hypothetical protein
MKTNSIIYVLLLLFTLVSCTKDKSPTNNLDHLVASATLTWQGSYAVDGCGFFVQINSKSYKPINESIIGKEFESNTSIAVRIEYFHVAENVSYFCGMVKQEMNGIEIFSIATID